jgi:DNA-binding MarR family transcriptional regulator
MVTSGTMTNRVDRLTGKGLVARLPEPGDRRGVRVRLTDKGRSRVDAALDGLLAQERRLLHELPASDQTVLADLLRTVVAPFDA